METHAIGAFLVYCIVNAFTPGPGNILALSTAASHGWRRGMPLYLGIFCGYFAVQALCALAVFWMGETVPDLLGSLKVVGAVYVVWLAVHIARSKPATDGAQSRASFAQGFLLQFVNVKIYLFGITALVGFVVGSASDLPTLMATEMFVAAVGTVATLTWVAFGVALQGVYLRHFRAANLLFAASLAFCAVEMLL